MPNRLINITGEKFGRLLVLSHHKRGGHKGRWECRCDCGATVYILSGDLRGGFTKSCGCLHQESAETHNLIDLTGQRFGALVAITRDGRRRGRIAWLCSCDCGVSTRVATSDLTSGNSVTCGCRCISHGHPGMYVFNSYKSRAKRSNIEFALTKDEFLSLIRLNCKYCGIPRMMVGVNQKKNNKDPAYTSFKWNGLDRVDNSKGYTLANVAPCCMYCNLAKKDFSSTQFLEWALRLSCHQGWVTNGTVMTVEV